MTPCVGYGSLHLYLRSTSRKSEQPCLGTVLARRPSTVVVDFKMVRLLSGLCRQARPSEDPTRLGGAGRNHIRVRVRLRLRFWSRCDRAGCTTCHKKFAEYVSKLLFQRNVVSDEAA